MKKIFSFLIISLLLLATEKAIPKELLENIEILKELDFFFFMEQIEKETKNNKKEDINSKTDISVSSISISTISVSTDNLKNIKISTFTGRSYEK